MSRVYIKFASDSDRISGVYELTTKTSVDCLPEEVFGLSSEYLYILEDRGISYTKATPEEVAASYERLRAIWNGKHPREVASGGIKSKAKSRLKGLFGIWGSNRTS